MIRRLLALAVLSSGLALPAIQADDPPSKLLEETANRARIANQAVKATVNDALSKVSKLPADAGLVVLAEAENQVKEAVYLPADEKKTLLSQIEEKRKALNNSSTFAPPSNPKTPKDDRALVEHQIRQELNSIRALQQQGQSTVAQARFKALSEKYPNHPAILAGSTVGARKEFTREQQDNSSKRAANEQAALNDISKSASSSTDSISIDKKALENAKGRADKLSSVSSLSAQEKKILRSLGDKASTDFNLNNVRFEDLMKMLEKEIGFPLIISKATMDDLRINYDTTLTYSIPRGVEKRTLLRSILGELGLTYIIKAETLQVVSVLQAKNEMRVGVLDIRSMINTGTNPDDLIKFIKSSIEPDSWDTGGGTGTITFNAGILIIRNSAEVIYGLGARRR